MRLWSEALADGKRIPTRYSKDGDNLSPPLKWADVPQGAAELALIFENVTPQTREPFAHWVVYGIAPDQGGLPEGFRHKRDPKAPEDVLQGSNDIGNVGYDGPLGTVGRTNRYRFRLLAVGEPLHLEPGVDREALLAAASGRVVAEAALEAEFERPP
jgi:Raf kinase inhibitor-like YbhB/YbcL family protein